MSRAYRIRIAAQESVKRDISASDEICTDLEMLEILPAEQMGVLLKDSLGQRGFEEQDGKMVRTQNGITISVDPNTAEVTIHIEDSEAVAIEAKRETWTYDPNRTAQEKAKESLKQAIRQELEKKIEEKEGVLQQKVSGELEAQLGEISRELDQVINEVTREALKRKAASLGAIKEMTEDPEAGSLTIKVEV
jgi:hypothetical protein